MNKILELYKDIIIKEGTSKLNEIKEDRERFGESLDQRISDLMVQLDQETKAEEI